MGELRSDIRELSAKVSGLPSRWEILIFLVGSVVSVVGLMLAILSYSGDRFGEGAQMSAVADAAAVKAVAAYSAQHPSVPPPSAPK
jgi:hypothetical protein